MSLFSLGQQGGTVDPSQQPGETPDQVAGSGPAFSGLSGNELYCIGMCGYRAGNLLVGNSVFALGFIGGVGSNIRTAVGGEIAQITNMIAEGRRLSIERFSQELIQSGAPAATGVTSELVFHPGNVEFLSVGSAINPTLPSQQNQARFTSSSDGQELFCQIDANYTPIDFVFGNVAYSIGVARGLLGSLKEMVKGEVTQFSNIFNVTRNLALDRIVNEAKSKNANSVVGIRTTILPIGINTIQEMVMIGTASYNPQIQAVADSVGGVVTSDLTAEEMWNVTKMGYVPLKLVLGTSVYSLGLAGGLKASIRNLVKGEIKVLSELIYGAREQSLKKIQQQAAEIGADDVLGIKTYIYDIGNGVIEFLAIGTAVKRISGLATRSEQLPPQAIIRDKDTFINVADMSYGTTLQHQSV
jgi:uncharacterized protein YbjQ (UPF0145 family)